MLITKKLKKIKCITLLSLSLVWLSTSHAYNFTQVDVFNDNTATHEDRIVLFASSSLNPILTQIIEDYIAKENANVTVIYMASATSAKQLENGVPIDLVISDNPQDMKSLVEINWVKNEKNLWGNRLALISAPAHDNVFMSGWRRTLTADNETKQKVNTVDSLIPSINDNFNVNELASWQNRLDASQTKGTKRLGLADPLFSGLGHYTQEMLGRLPFAKEIYQQSVYSFDDGILKGQLQDNNIDYAILYYTDALKFFENEIIALIPDNLHSEIIYTLGEVNKPQNPAKKAKIESLVNYMSDSSVSLKMLENGFLLTPSLIQQPSFSLPVLSEVPSVNMGSENNTLQSDLPIIEAMNPLLLESNLINQPETIQPVVETPKE